MTIVRSGIDRQRQAEAQHGESRRRQTWNLILNAVQVLELGFIMYCVMELWSR